LTGLYRDNTLLSLPADKERAILVCLLKVYRDSDGNTTITTRTIAINKAN